jgi:hypothetical protein
MNRRLHILTAWLLPLLCLRALLPVGFMPVVTESGWQIVMCSGSAYQSRGQAIGKAATTNKSDAGDSNHSNQQKQTSDGPCVFAISAATAPIPFVAATDFAPSFDRSYLRISGEWMIARPLIRAQQSRAPPQYS